MNCRLLATAKSLPLSVQTMPTTHDASLTNRRSVFALTLALAALVAAVSVGAGDQACAETCRPHRPFRYGRGVAVRAWATAPRAVDEPSLLVHDLALGQYRGCDAFDRLGAEAGNAGVSGAAGAEMPNRLGSCNGSTVSASRRGAPRSNDPALSGATRPRAD